MPSLESPNAPVVTQPFTREQVKMLLDVGIEYVKRRIGKKPIILMLLSGLWAGLADDLADQLIAYLKLHGYGNLFA